MADHTFKLGRPKPPPPPTETPARSRMRKLTAGLERLCETIEELAEDQAAEERQRVKMSGNRKRIADIDEELQKLQRSQKLKHQASTLEETDEAEALRRQLRGLQEERTKLERELTHAAPAAKDEGIECKQSQDSVESWSMEAIQYLNVMANSSSRDVRVRMTMAIARVAERSAAWKEQVCRVPKMAKHPMATLESATIIERIVELMKAGGLEAIEAISVLTTSSLRGCNMVREAGAVAALAGFINTESEHGVPVTGGGPSASGGNADEQVEQSTRDGVANLHDLGDIRPTIVPVSVKARAVSALRNIATSSSHNLENITSQRVVIPQLVQLMTKMNEEKDNASSKGSSSGGSSGDGDGDGSESSKQARRQQRRANRSTKLNEALREKMEAEMLDRKQLAKDNRKLAESAGQMLHTLIIEGSTEVKKIIISAIITQVQQPGSVPPEDVPALMTILKSTAEEQVRVCVCVR